MKKTIACPCPLASHKKAFRTSGNGPNTLDLCWVTKIIHHTVHTSDHQKKANSRTRWKQRSWQSTIHQNANGLGKPHGGAPESAGLTLLTVHP